MRAFLAGDCDNGVEEPWSFWVFDINDVVELLDIESSIL